jgi:hypothetical protein
MAIYLQISAVFWIAKKNAYHFCIWEVPDGILHSLGYSNSDFSWFPSFSPDKCWDSTLKGATVASFYIFSKSSFTFSVEKMLNKQKQK